MRFGGSGLVRHRWGGWFGLRDGNGRWGGYRCGGNLRLRGDDGCDLGPTLVGGERSIHLVGGQIGLQNGSSLGTTSGHGQDRSIVVPYFYRRAMVARERFDQAQRADAVAAHGQRQSKVHPHGRAAWIVTQHAMIIGLRLLVLSQQVQRDAKVGQSACIRGFGAQDVLEQACGLIGVGGQSDAAEPEFRVERGRFLPKCLLKCAASVLVLRELRERVAPDQQSRHIIGGAVEDCLRHLQSDPRRPRAQGCFSHMDACPTGCRRVRRPKGTSRHDHRQQACPQRAADAGSRGAGSRDEQLCGA